MDFRARRKTSEGEPIISKSSSNKIFAISYFVLAPCAYDPLCCFKSMTDVLDFHLLYRSNR